jgi:tRNA pseudouridine55 synthase
MAQTIANKEYLNTHRRLSEDIEDYPDGIIIPIDKPYRWTSADVIRKVKFAAVKHFHQRNLKVGHAGTLDPLATGVLLVCIGKATKMAQELQDHDKQYIAGVTFGATTPSYDLEKPIDRTFPHDKVSKESIEGVLPQFIGTQEQIAPLFSAKSSDGVRAYELARKMYRKGENGFDEAATDVLQKSTITISKAELLSYNEDGIQANSAAEQPSNLRNSRINVTDNSALGLPHADILIDCSKGTYIRAFARDLGEALETGAHLDSLRRTLNGGFTVEESLSVDEALALLSPAQVKSRSYKVAGNLFNIRLEEPWDFAPISEEKAAIVAKGKAGEAVDTLPITADDEANALSTKPIEKHLLFDSFQYEPFSCEQTVDPDFSITIKARKSYWLDAAVQDGRMKLTFSEAPVFPMITVYIMEGHYYFCFKAENGRTLGYLELSEDHRQANYYRCKGIGPQPTSMQINSSLMLLFTYNSSLKGCLLMHSSVVRYGDKANMFLGASGTGKSTHSKLWLKNIPGCDLINDDNPILKQMPDGSIRVFGSPWSGKTPCYRNVDFPVRAIVRLEQAKENSISRIESLDAYASVISSISSIRWDKEIMDALSKTVEAVAMNVKCFRLQCLPDPEAAKLCLETTIR